MSENGWVDYFGVIAAKKKQILIFTLVCALAAGAGFFFVPKTYESGLTMDVGIFSIIAKMENESDEILTEPIEPVLVVRDAITSEPFMASVISALNLNISPGKLKKRVKAKVNEDLKDEFGLVNRQVIVSAKGETPDEAKAIAETVAGIVIERHGELYEQAMENRYEYEKTLAGQIDRLDSEMAAVKEKLLQYYGEKGKHDTALLVLMQDNLLEQEEHLTKLKRELSQSLLLNKATLKSTNTRITVPAFLPSEPSISLVMFVVIGLIVGFLLSSGYYTAREAART